MDLDSGLIEGGFCYRKMKSTHTLGVMGVCSYPVAGPVENWARWCNEEHLTRDWSQTLVSFSGGNRCLVDWIGVLLSTSWRTVLQSHCSTIGTSWPSSVPLTGHGWSRNDQRGPSRQNLHLLRQQNGVHLAYEYQYPEGLPMPRSCWTRLEHVRMIHTYIQK